MHRKNPLIITLAFVIIFKIITFATVDYATKAIETTKFYYDYIYDIPSKDIGEVFSSECFYSIRDRLEYERLNANTNGEIENYSLDIRILDKTQKDDLTLYLLKAESRFNYNSVSEETTISKGVYLLFKEGYDKALFFATEKDEYLEELLGENIDLFDYKSNLSILASDESRSIVEERLKKLSFNNKSISNFEVSSIVVSVGNTLLRK